MPACKTLNRCAKRSPSLSTNCRAGNEVGESATACSDEKKLSNAAVKPVLAPAITESNWPICAAKAFNSAKLAVSVRNC